jgi:serine/threonine protein kinase
MTPERWKQVEQIFFKAIELPQEKRPSFLLAECGDDSELFCEVESLLHQEDETGAIMKTIISHAADSFTRKGIENLKGKRIGAYRLIDLIGKGGMAEVYKAVRDDDQYQKQVAIKLIRGERSFLIGRFWHERQILANLEYHNIARFLEGGTKGDVDQGELFLKNAQQVWKKTLPPQHDNQARVLLALGRVRLKKGDFAEAEKIFRQVLEARKKNMPEDHLSIARVKGFLGESLKEQKRYAEAEPLIVESYRAFKAELDTNHRDVIESAERLKLLYAAWGKPASNY